jgi:predicted RNA binding protein YcfA (HicA-like mRNA interferase family)
MSPKLKNITAREFVRALERDGFIFKRQKGSHKIYKHPESGNWVSVPYHPGGTFTKGILGGLIDDAGWTEDDLVRLKLMRK